MRVLFGTVLAIDHTALLQIAALASIILLVIAALYRPLAVSAFDPAFLRRYPVRQVATYGPPSVQRQARSGQPLDQEMIDRLRSLGYVK